MTALDPPALMAEALRLAARGIYSTAPNPRVGCVLVRDGQIVGRGFHRYAGEAHAEVHALAEAGDRARGATAYVTLEPCAHQGRTPPCADALIRAGVRDLVIACRDPNPLVAGRGIARLEAAGIRTRLGLGETEALRLNRGFFSRIQRGRPWLTLKLAASLDGRTALANGQSQWLTGAAARADVQRLRLEADAVLAGTGSVIADRARLTARHDTDLPRREPLRVVIDSQNRVVPPLPLFDEAGPVLLARLRPGPRPEGGSASVEEHCYPARAGRVDLAALLNDLGARGINNVLAEAGANLAGALLQAELVDELVLYLAPCLLGPDARPLVALPLLEALSARMNFRLERSECLAADVKLTLIPSYVHRNH